MEDVKIKKGSRLKQLFDSKKANEKVMSLFITAGYPDLESTVNLVLGFEENGAEIIELGMPFSDPLADGPTIQYANNIAIGNGITMNKIFAMVEQIRLKSDIPIILMGYINPVLRYGVDRFCKRASEAGVDGLIIPDAPVEESTVIAEAAKNEHLNLIYLVAPNSSDKRMQIVDQNSSGFVYCVSVTGVTGARSGNEVADSVKKFIHRVNENVTKNPKLVGFGIKNHDDAQIISKEVDGFIVGSALIDTIRKHYPENGWVQPVFEFVHKLKHGN
jgi:tryptophan synthase alpha chain